MIFDASRGNRRFRPPPGTALLTGEGLGRVYMQDASSLWTTSSGDLLAAVLPMRIDSWLARHFCLHAVIAKTSGMTGRKLENRDTLVSLMSTTFLVGFSWSTYFGQDVTEMVGLFSPVFPSASVRGS